MYGVGSGSGGGGDMEDIVVAAVIDRNCVKIGLVVRIKEEGVNGVWGGFINDCRGICSIDSIWWRQRFHRRIRRDCI